MKYKKIEQKDVYNLLADISVDIMNPLAAINLVNIASFLKTSRYQVKKYMDNLKKEGFVELKQYDLNSYDEEQYMPCPPYWGYSLTEKGKDTEEYRTKQEDIRKLIKECFGELGTLGNIS